MPFKNLTSTNDHSDLIQQNQLSRHDPKLDHDPRGQGRALKPICDANILTPTLIDG